MPTAMTTIPKCLESADKAGIIRHRTPATERDYRLRYAGMARTLARQQGVPHVEVEDVIQDVLGRSTNLRRSTFYQYRAAIFQSLRDKYVAGELTDRQAISLSKRMSALETKAIGSKVTTVRTSSGRIRHMRPEVNGALVSVIAANPRPTAQNLADMIEYAPLVGLRPCEFIGARLEGTKLWIQSAKFSAQNERGLASRRQIELRDAFDEADLAILARLFARLNAEFEAAHGNRTRIVRRYAAALRLARSKVPSANRVTLYTGRGQFRANVARAGYSPEEVAALMGHASAQTAGSNYAPSSRGWAPVRGSRPVDVPAAQVARVRPGARAKAKVTGDKKCALDSAQVPKGP
jgi:integrase